MVVFAHGHERGFLFDVTGFGPMQWRLPSAAIGAGYLGVTFFFFISGFVLFLPYARHLVDGRPKPTLGHFVNRRFFKIVPSYIVALLVVAAIAPDDVPPGQLAHHVFVHLAMIHNFWPDTFVSIIGPLWSLAIEIEFYVLFPLLVVVMLRNVWAMCALLIAIGWIARAWVHAHHLDGQFIGINQLPPFLDLFGFGMLSSYVVTLVRAGRLPMPSVALATTISVIAATVVYGLFGGSAATGGGPHEWEWENANRGFIALGLFAFVTLGMFSTVWWRAIFSAAPLVWFAGISYNVYLWNKPIVGALSRVLGPHWREVPHVDLVFPILFLGLSTIAGWLATTIVERPIQRWGATVFAKKAPRPVQQPTT